MSCCFSAERARLARRVAPAFCPEDAGGGGAEVEVVEARQKECLVGRNECDSASALIRGLAQYLSSLQMDHLGRDVSLRAVFEEWPDVQDLGGTVDRFPAAGVSIAQDAGQYKSSQQADVKEMPGQPDVDTVTALVIAGHYTATVLVEVMATEREDRIGVCMALEEAFLPRDHTSSLVLRLPFSFGQHARYTLVSGGPTGTGTEAGVTIWAAQYKLVGELAVGYLRQYPRAKRITPRGAVGVGVTPALSPGECDS